MDSTTGSEEQHPQLQERKDSGAGLSVHMTFGYRSDLKQFSDRVIRVHVQRDPLEGGGALRQPEVATTRTEQSHGSDFVASQELSNSRCEDHAVDLEMQPVARNEDTEEDEDSQGELFEVTAVEERPPVRFAKHQKSETGTSGSSYDIPVSSIVIAAYSTYFMRMLTSGLQESTASKEQPIVVTLSPRDAQSFNALVEFMYTHKISATVRSDKEELCWLVTVADRFETPACVQTCVETLTSTPTTLADAVMYVSLPEPVKRCEAVRALIDTVSNFTDWSFEEIAGAETVCEMDELTIRRLVLKLRGSDEYEEELCKVCLQWFRSASRDRWGAFAALLELLEFWRINRSFIREELESCAEISSSPERRALIDKLKTMEPPLEDKELEVHENQGGALAAQGPGQAVAGNNAPPPFPGGPIAENVMTTLLGILIVLGFLAGFVIPLVFAARVKEHHHGLSDALFATAFLGLLPVGGAIVGLIAGVFLLIVWFFIHDCLLV
ncbi:hypothetical protein KFL_000230260 [Klebsormidium nitens]|uniref:BTB domain-containing protein n=1 Tax=Klebsormidium nitens TaxID=105231 RepID=A0A1Y1HR25_KLENI|nr:hypothetical protein KFL_000230260 [Klebsormidium nitens]|eukprot:GAQ79046.1 hypothetical protein KFL_000230260 [Klebsormidium nitens]